MTTSSTKEISSFLSSLRLTTHDVLEIIKLDSTALVKKINMQSLLLTDLEKKLEKNSSTLFMRRKVQELKGKSAVIMKYFQDKMNLQKFVGEQLKLSQDIEKALIYSGVKQEKVAARPFPTHQNFVGILHKKPVFSKEQLPAKLVLTQKEFSEKKTTDRVLPTTGSAKTVQGKGTLRHTLSLASSTSGSSSSSGDLEMPLSLSPLRRSKEMENLSDLLSLPATERKDAGVAFKLPAIPGIDLNFARLFEKAEVIAKQKAEEQKEVEMQKRKENPLYLKPLNEKLTEINRAVTEGLLEAFPSISFQVIGEVLAEITRKVKCGIPLL